MQDSITTQSTETIVTPVTEGQGATPPIVPDPAINIPPRDEGTPDTKEQTDDATFLQLFGKSAEQFVDGEVVKEAMGAKVTMTEPIKPSDNPLDPPVAIPPVSPKVELPGANPTPAVTQLSTFTQEQVDELVNTRVAEEVQKFQHINTFFEEYQKDPYAYMAKHSPHLFEKFNEVEYVQGKMAEEFGEFIPDPNRALQIGTTDYNYVQRQNALLAEARGLKQTAENTITAEQSKIEQDEQSYKAAKAQSLGLDMSTFESQVWAKLKSLSPQNALDLMVNAVIYEGKLKEKDTNIKTQIDLTKVAPSPSNLAGTGRPVDAEDKEMQMLKKMFGDEFD